VTFFGGTYDGAVWDLPERCSCCGRAIGAGSSVVSPFGEIYVIQGGEGGWRAEHLPADQLTLDELVAGDEAA
jgi:hypothetical protein